MQLLIAYMSDGTTKTQTFMQHVRPVTINDLSDVELRHQANVVVAVDTQTGVSRTLKNRWGPVSFDEKKDRLAFKPFPANAKIKAIGTVPKMYFHASSPLQIEQHCSCEDCVRWRMESSGAVKYKPETEVYKSKTCRCSAINLLSVGHDSDCPEKK